MSIKNYFVPAYLTDSNMINSVIIIAKKRKLLLKTRLKRKIMYYFLKQNGLR